MTEIETMSLNEKVEPSSKIYGHSYTSKQPFFTHLENSKILDIGCGTGQLAEFLNKKNNQCWGITISEAEAELARNHMQAVKIANLDECLEFDYPDKFFDCLVFADILEHCRNPHKVLKKLLRYLKPDGEIIISLPNIANFKIRFDLMCGKFDYQPYGIMDETHLRFYTLKSASKLLRQSELEIKEIRYSFWNWNIPIINKLCKGALGRELQAFLTRLRPGFFATQFVIYCRKKADDGK